MSYKHNTINYIVSLFIKIKYIIIKNIRFKLFKLKLSVFLLKFVQKTNSDIISNTIL